MEPTDVIGELSQQGARPRWLWPSSASKVRVHAILMAIVLWAGLAIAFTAGAGDRSIAGPIKGADFLVFYTMGSLAGGSRAQTLYDVNAFHQAQVALVSESDAELYPPVYPPQAALFFAPFSRLPFRHAMFAWSLITIALFGAIVRSAWRPVAKDLPDSLFVFAAAASFPPFWSLVLYGQATILILAAFWAGWLALERDRRFWAGMAFGLLSFKPQFAIPLAILVLVNREWKMLAGAVASVAIQAGAVVAVLGWSAMKGYAALLPVMLQHADLLEPKPFQSHSLRALTRLAPTWIGLPMWAVLSAMVVLYMLRLWKSEAPLRVRLGMVILASVLVNPHLIVYDATVLVLPLIWFGAYVQERSSQAEAALFWTSVYWLFVTLLAPTAAAIGVQVSVLLMTWLVVQMTRGASLAGVGANQQRNGDPGRDRALVLAASAPAAGPTS